MFGEIEVKKKPKTKPKKQVKSKSKPAKTIKPKTKFSDFPIIILLWGEAGHGKSTQVMQFEKPMIILDLENRLLPLAIKNKFPVENIINAVNYNEKFDIDGPKTLDDVRNAIDKIFNSIASGENIRTIAVDGISDIRPFAVKEWLSEKPGRQRPATAGDWREINDKVRDICFRVINFGRANDINIVFTAYLGGKYEKLERIADVPAVKDWVEYNVDHIFHIYANGGRFLAYCEKSWYDPFFTIDLTGNVSLFQLLKNPKLLEQKIKERKEVKEQEEVEMF
ncbi:MAG: AAA family ATPase [Promethearchaeota archaeon]